MILLLLTVFLILIFFGCLLYFYIAPKHYREDKYVTAYCTLNWIGGLGGFLCLCITIWLGVSVSNLMVIEDKIAMYEEENTRIETQIATAVKQYQDHEKDVFDSMSPEDVVALVALYPELKSDTLVQKQLDTYVSNNEKIKELKNAEIDGDVMRFWLYFGGMKHE